MESKDNTAIICPGCKGTLLYSKSDLRATRSLAINCPCGHKQTFPIDDTMQELVTAILSVALGSGEYVDSRNITAVSGDPTSSRLTLSLKDGKLLEIPTSRFNQDIDTLKSCGIAVQCILDLPN